MKFLKQSEVKLVDGGYLVDSKKNPISNKDFEIAQQSAHYIVNFAKLAKTKNFTTTKVDTLEELKAEVTRILKDKTVKFVEAKNPELGELNLKLKVEAMNFMEAVDNAEKAEKVNAFLQQFAILKEFQEFGLFFTEGIVKLDKIYSLEEIIEAVEETIELLIN
jgi:hypothetical protein